MKIDWKKIIVNRYICKFKLLEQVKKRWHIVFGRYDKGKLIGFCLECGTYYALPTDIAYQYDGLFYNEKNELLSFGQVVDLAKEKEF